MLISIHHLFYHQLCIHTITNCLCLGASWNPSPSTVMTPLTRSTFYLPPPPPPLSTPFLLHLHRVSICLQHNTICSLTQPACQRRVMLDGWQSHSLQTFHPTIIIMSPWDSTTSSHGHDTPPQRAHRNRVRVTDLRLRHYKHPTTSHTTAHPPAMEPGAVHTPAVPREPSSTADATCASTTSDTGDTSSVGTPDVPSPPPGASPAGRIGADMKPSIIPASSAGGKGVHASSAGWITCGITSDGFTKRRVGRGESSPAI